MNERIKQLALEAGMKSPDQFKLTLSHMATFQLEKFAELIVQECIRYFNEDYVRDFDTLWREDLSKGMKQHFGVE